MLIPTTYVAWALFFGGSLCAAMIGLNVGRGKREQTVQDTIDFLIENNYLRAKPLEDGDIELLPYDDK